MNSLGYSINKIMSSVNRDSFTSSSAVSMPFISFSCPFALARISSTLLNRSGENGYPSLVSDLVGESFQLCTTEYNVSCRFSKNAIYQVEEVPYTPSLLNVFIILIFQILFLHQMRWLCGFPPVHSITIVYYTDFHI